MLNSWLSTGASVYVERIFSRGCLVLLHVRNHLSAESTCAVLCVGEWVRLGWVEDHDILAVAKGPEVEGEDTLEENWVELVRGATDN